MGQYTILLEEECVTAVFFRLWPVMVLSAKQGTIHVCGPGTEHVHLWTVGGFGPKSL
jgi:hypothetical protein